MFNTGSNITRVPPLLKAVMPVPTPPPRTFVLV